MAFAIYLYILNLTYEIKKNYTSFHPVGRNGLHKYNNQDHAMMTAILTVKNIIAKKTEEYKKENEIKEQVLLKKKKSSIKKFLIEV